MIHLSFQKLIKFKLLFIFGIITLDSSSILASPCGSFISNLNQRLELSEGWQFRKGDNMDWKEAQVEESFWISRKIPDYGISKTNNISGYHWYRCKLVLPENFEAPRNPLGINLGMIRDIDEVYFNGILIGKTGSLVPYLEPDFQKIRIYSIPTKLLIAGENIISIRIYSVGYQQGLKSIPSIFDEAKLFQKMYSSESIPIGFGYIFILMGIYFLTGAFIRGLRAENSFFGLFSIHIGLYTLIRTQYRYEMFESFTNSYIFELMVLIPLPALFINFLIFHLDSKRNIIVIAFEVFLAILFFTVPFTKTSVGWNIVITAFNYGLPIAFGIVVFYIARSFKENFPKLRFILIGLLGLLPTIIIDSLTALEIISINGTIYFGFFFFLILISVQLSEEMVSSLEKYLAMESELIQMEKIKTGFLLNISNEFKTGIEKITSSLIKLKSTKKNSNKKELPASLILDFQIRNTISMIDEAILLSNLEEKKYSKILNPFDPKQIIDECVQLSELRLDQKRKNLHITINPYESIFQIDTILFKAIARNLIENAFLYTDKTVRIDIEFEVFSNKFTFTVADEGLGMNHFEQENLFKKFIRGESKNTIPGAGIGLTLVYAAVKELGGEIKVKSSEGMGAMFIATIPFTPILQPQEQSLKKLGRKKV
jgi:signal transduction histidine kinase